MQISKKERFLLLSLLVGILLAGSVYLYGGKKSGQDVSAPVPPTGTTTNADGGNSSSSGNTTPAPSGTKQMIKVNVKGDVNDPGVYQLPADSRVIDAIQAAGGQKPDAVMDQLNLAAVVTDGAEIIVPGPGDPPKSADSGGSTDGKLNLNTASAADLDKLPGIGNARAQAIVTYRTDHGPFSQVDDLKNVPGFGPKLLNEIRDRVTVGTP